MKKFLLAFLFLAVVTMMGCCVHSNLKHPAPRSTLIDELVTDTVALVEVNDDGDYATFCAGVWVDKDLILTADHCARSQLEPIVELFASMDSDSTDESKVEMVEKLEDGFPLKYFVQSDYTGVFKEPKRTYAAKVLKHDRTHDLALLKVDPKDFPKHTVVALAWKQPEVGEEVHVMGHVVGMAWTYTKGIVSGYREEDFRPTKKRGQRGPFMQFAGEVFSGNSGGGAFNENRELVGIASFIVPAPNQAMFVHVDTIRDFLDRRTPRR